MNASYSCFCTRYTRLKHRQVMCDECSSPVQLGGYTWAQIIQYRINSMREKIRFIAAKWWKHSWIRKITGGVL